MANSAARKSFNINDTIFHDIAYWFQHHDSLPPHLYSCPFTTLAVFRSLPPLARLYIGRLLTVETSKPVDIDQFSKALRRRQRAKDRHGIAVGALRALHIFTVAADNMVYANPMFMHQLRSAVTYQLPGIFDKLADGQRELTNEQLDDYSAQRLESILNYVVASSGQRRPSDRLLSSLVYTGILEQQARSNALCITSHGFHFLLKHSFAQLWILLRSLLLALFHQREDDAREPYITEVLNLLFRLSFTEPGAKYSTKALTPGQVDLLTELDQLGIVVMSHSITHDGVQDLDEEEYFCPTLVGVRLLSSANRIGPDLSGADLPNVTKTTGEIHIFVETNFRVYAYTTSPFQTNLLALFTHMRCKLPGLVVGHLTRDAVRSALMNGITAQQIIAYLNAHAHPRMKRGTIPSNVADEIRLWEAEQERVQLANGNLLSNFSSQFSYDRVLAHANDNMQCVLWHSTERLMMVVDSEHFDEVRQYIRENSLQ